MSMICIHLTGCMTPGDHGPSACRTAPRSLRVDSIRRYRDLVGEDRARALIGAQVVADGAILDDDGEDGRSTVLLATDDGAVEVVGYDG